jgi:hypothetical protein
MANEALESAGRGVLRSALAGSLVWVGALKFAEYEAENIQPMVSTSPLFSRIIERLGTRKTARLISLGPGLTGDSRASEMEISVYPPNRRARNPLDLSASSSARRRSHSSLGAWAPSLFVCQ